MWTICWAGNARKKKKTAIIERMFQRSNCMLLTYNVENDVKNNFFRLFLKNKFFEFSFRCQPSNLLSLTEV